MQGQAPQTHDRLLLSEERCSDEIRSLATTHGWALLEGIGATPAIHACVAMEPRRVCVEYTNQIRTVPDLIRRLAALQSVGRVACFVPSVCPNLEQSLASIGAQAFTTTQDITTWLNACDLPAKDPPATAPFNGAHQPRTPPRAARVNRRIHMIPKGA